MKCKLLTICLTVTLLALAQGLQLADNSHEFSPINFNPPSYNPLSLVGAGPAINPPSISLNKPTLPTIPTPSLPSLPTLPTIPTPKLPSVPNLSNLAPKIPTINAPKIPSFGGSIIPTPSPPSYNLPFHFLAVHKISPTNGVCPGNSTVNSKSGLCGCSANYALAGNGTCMYCPSPYFFDYRFDICVRCPKGFVYNTTYSACICPKAAPFLDANNKCIPCSTAWNRTTRTCLKCHNNSTWNATAQKC